MVYWLNYSVIYLIPLIVLSLCSTAFKLALTVQKKCISLNVRFDSLGFI